MASLDADERTVVYARRRRHTTHNLKSASLGAASMHEAHDFVIVMAFDTLLFNLQLLVIQNSEPHPAL